MRFHLNLLNIISFRILYEVFNLIFICLHELLLKELCSKLCQCVSLTIDISTSTQKINYFFNEHFIDKHQNLHENIIDFNHIANDRSENIGKPIQESLIDCRLEKKVIIAMVNNVSSNDVSYQYLKEKFIWRGLSIYKEKHLHMRCITYTFNLFVWDGRKRTIIALNVYMQQLNLLTKHLVCCISLKDLQPLEKKMRLFNLLMFIHDRIQHISC